MFELQVKIDGCWLRIDRHLDESYLKIIGERQFARHKKQRIVKIW
jgi:hypothetical protein